MRNFQLIMLVLFIFGGVLGIFVFAGFIDLEDSAVNQGPTGTVVLWGTLPSNVVNPIISDFNKGKTYTVKYVAKREDSFERELLEAIALGNSPDLFLIANDLIYKNSNKISKIPYTNYPLFNFKNNFATAGEVFLTKEGILALPITINPMVMYYNRSILDENSVAYPPEYWDELEQYANKFTKKDSLGNINQSSFALGQYSNITHAKNILATLFLQKDNTIIEQATSIFRANLSNPSIIDKNVGVLNFYTDFANPLSKNYSWNKSFSSSLESFSREELVFYFGLASDLRVLLARNPNHNFIASPIPQYKDGTKTTYARVTGLSMSAFAKNKSAATDAMNSLAMGDFSLKISNVQYLPPARRDLLAQRGTDTFTPVFYSSALFAKSWLDPSAIDSDNVFRAMIDEILSNQRSPESALTGANNRLNLLLNN